MLLRGKAKATNVLSWPSEERGSDDEGGQPDLPDPGPADDPEHLGDIAISYDTCMAEAKAADKPAADHVTHLVIHALLHLLGYDHRDEDEKEIMFGIQERYLRDWKVSR